MMDLSTIETLTKQFSDARRVLAERVEALNDEIEQAKRRKLPGIKSAVEIAAAARHVLVSAIAEGLHLFIKPKSQVYHGVKVGVKKGEGLFRWDDESQVIKLIRKHLPDQADTLIRQRESVSRDALKGVSAADIKKIGVRIEGDGEQIIVKPVDSDVDKIVASLLATEQNEDVREAA